MSDAKLWIDEVGCTATITGTNVSYTMPLWVLDVMRDIIWADAEKEVEVTHSDFDTQQELLDRYRAENAKLRELAAQALQIIKNVNIVMAIDWSRHSAVMSMARELGIEVDE